VAVAGQSVGAAYTERHLINVTSSPLVGAALLLPLLGLLFLPGLLAARRVRDDLAPGASDPPSPQLSDGPSVIVVAPAVESAPVAVLTAQSCVSCAAPLRPGARFCGRCGATQPAPPAAAGERRSFCDMCGRPLLPGASFCAACGTEVLGSRMPL
jgi:hypothetical protein